MDTTTVAAQTTRLQRGITLHRERGSEITRTTGGTYHVPSCTGEGHYVVYLGEVSFCSCPDHRRAAKVGEACKHRTAARIFAAKRRAARRRNAAAS